MDASTTHAADPVSEARDAWMRRTGPFFPLLVAAAAQTRLPVAPDLDPTEIDVVRAEPWSPLVGALLGLSLGFVGALLIGLGLDEFAVSALLVSAWVFAGGAWAELGVARVVERLLAKSPESAAPALGFTMVLVISLLLRVTLLLSISPSSWTAALLVSAAVARFGPLAARHAKTLARVVRRTASPPSVPVLIAVGLVAVGLPIAVGYAALAAVLVALAAAAVLAIADREAPDALMVWAVEIAALVCFAASGTFPLLAS